MSFVGIIAKKKKEKDLEKMGRLVYPNQVIYLAEKDLVPLKNVQFETIVIQDAVSHKDVLSNLLQNCKYIVIDSDTGMESLVQGKEEQAVITYGYHRKDTVTFSSLTDHTIQVCLQRKIQKQSGEWIEPQEIILFRRENEAVRSLLGYGTLQILYQEKGEKKVENQQKS